MEPYRELENANRALKEASMQLETVKLHILHLEKEIAMLTSYKINIEQNLSILKYSTTVSVASEFKKSKNDLNKVENRLVFLKIDLTNHSKALQKAEKTLKDCKQKIIDLMTKPTGKIIKGKFGNRDGQS